MQFVLCHNVMHYLILYASTGTDLKNKMCEKAISEKYVRMMQCMLILKKQITQTYKLFYSL